ncbi:MAG: aldo/keto reductase [Rhodovibrionaceae bacterium]|nr:aldo/keto reductase [Rhodovibrionaceae bacterium]
MRYVERKGARVPALGFGTWQLKGDECVDMVRFALDEVGYRHIDTAQAYENEDEVGQAIADSDADRDEVFLTTKVWMDRLEPDDMKRSAEESLQRLKTDYVDLLLIHWPNPEVDLDASLRALEELKSAGKARHIGVSNFTVKLLKEAVEEHGADLLCNQVEYHPFMSQTPVLDYLRGADMMLTAYCPIAQGETFGNPVLKRIGQTHDKNEAQVALRWLIEQDGVAAIPRTSNKDHCRQNFEIFDFALSDGEIAEIDGLEKGARLINPSWAPAWDTAA